MGLKLHLRWHKTGEPVSILAPPNLLEARMPLSKLHCIDKI